MVVDASAPQMTISRWRKRRKLSVIIIKILPVTPKEGVWVMRDTLKDSVWAGALWSDHGPEKETFGSYGLLGEFSLHPPDKNLDFDLACFLIRSPRPGLPSNRNPDRALPVRHEPEPGLFPVRCLLASLCGSRARPPCQPVSLTVGEESRPVLALPTHSPSWFSYNPETRKVLPEH